MQEITLPKRLLNGVAATDWSWSALFGDYDQDGEQDLLWVME
jgi:hypothetical protein